MFYGELAETKDSIELSDCEYESMLGLFCYMYSDEVSRRNVMGVLYRRNTYLVPLLVDSCGQFLGENSNATNVFSILTFAQKELETDYQCRDNLFYIMASKTLLYCRRFNCMKSDIITVSAVCVSNLKLKYYFL